MDYTISIQTSAQEGTVTKLLLANKGPTSFNASKETRFLTFPECPFLCFHPAMEKRNCKEMRKTVWQNGA